MKVRIRFTKQGPLKFIGHLDIMRYFQKLIKRAGIPIAYSNGMSPHQIMSFALPLGIGDESIGEYLDIELTESVNSKAAIDCLNAQTVNGIEILSFKQLDDKALNAMASVEAADYKVSFRNLPTVNLKNDFESFMKSSNISVVKKTKKNESEIDIKPFIFDFSASDSDVSLRLKCGSVDNTKPELVMKAFYEYLAVPFDEFNLLILRKDLLTNGKNGYISLDDVGSEII